MAIVTSIYLNVPERASALGLQLPDTLLFLPENFQTALPSEELHFRAEMVTAKKLLGAGGIPVQQLGGMGDPTAFIHNRSHEWALPIIFIGTEMMKDSPDLIGQALSLIQNYVVDIFKGAKGKSTIKAEIVIEDRQNKQYKKLTYEGDPEGLKELTAALKAISRKR